MSCNCLKRSANLCCVTVIFTFIWIVQADVLVVSRHSNVTINAFADLPASFGKVLPFEGLQGCVISANPPQACKAIDPPPQRSNCSEKWFVLIKRYECNFVDKVRSAQQAGFDAAIVYNIGSNLIEPMAGEDADDINISAVFIGQDDGLKIQSLYQYNQGYVLLLTNELPFNINSYLLPFAIVVAICFAIMVIFMLVKCVKDRRRMRRYRLPSSCLKTIPTNKFKKGDPYETCAICLEDYIDDDRLRILPCSHAYHCKCIDPWLTRNRRVCPVCKRRVVTRGERFSDSESETEDETRPLIRHGTYGTLGRTFSSLPESVSNGGGDTGASEEASSHRENEHSLHVPSDSLVTEYEEHNPRNDQASWFTEVEVSSDLDTETQQDDVNVNNSVYLTPQSLRSHGTSNA